MNEYIVLPNALITEAILDIKVQLTEPTTLKIVDKLHNTIKQRVPKIGARDE